MVAQQHSFTPAKGVGVERLTLAGRLELVPPKCKHLYGARHLTCELVQASMLLQQQPSNSHRWRDSSDHQGGYFSYVQPEHHQTAE